MAGGIYRKIELADETDSLRQSERRDSMLVRVNKRFEPIGQLDLSLKYVEP